MEDPTKYHQAEAYRFYNLSHIDLEAFKLLGGRYGRKMWLGPVTTFGGGRQDTNDNDPTGFNACLA